jgi:hypothetical protein
MPAQIKEAVPPPDPGLPGQATTPEVVLVAAQAQAAPAGADLTAPLLHREAEAVQGAVQPAAALPGQ